MIVLSDLPLLLAPLFSLGLGVLLHRRQSLLLRPSVLFMVGNNLLYQWPAVMHTSVIDSVPYAGDWYAMAFGLPFAWLMWMWFLHLRHPDRLDATYQLARRVSKDIDAYPGSQAPLYLAWLFALPIAGVYLAQVPLESTGLWAMLFDPLNSDQAREESWKLLDDPVTKYAFGWLVHVLAPVLVCAHFLALRDSFRMGRLNLVACHAVLLCSAFGFACLSGARATAMLMVFGLMILAWLISGLKLRLVWLGLAVGVMLIIPAVMTAQRSGRAISVENVADCYVKMLEGRLSEVPIVASSAFVGHTQVHGYYWGDTIKFVALAQGRQPVNLPNLIGRAYFVRKLDSVSANTGMLFSFYADFALPGAIGLSTAMLFFIDRCAAWLLSLRPGRVAAVLLVVFGNSCVALLQSAAPVTFVSGGLWMILGAGWFSQRCGRSRSMEY